MSPKMSRSVDVCRDLPTYLASYRGGRNESFMYGKSDGQTWYDYDLTSAYTTVMSLLGDPVYRKSRRLTGREVCSMSDDDLLFNYVVIDVEFEFDKGVVYPNIPVRVDDNVDVYPMKGRSVVTGPEFLVARNSGCKLDVKYGVITPFSQLTADKGENGGDVTEDKGGDVNGLVYEAPFRSIIKGLQEKRREYSKKTFHNLMYKQIGNSVYGQVSMGMSGKKRYDVASKSFVRVDGGSLSNPMLASYITGFTRALIGECLVNIGSLGGKVVSATTDGFLTDISGLEDKILKGRLCKAPCLLLYKRVRRLLTSGESDEALEVKYVERKGLLS